MRSSSSILFVLDSTSSIDWKVDDETMTGTSVVLILGALVLRNRVLEVVEAVVDAVGAFEVLNLLIKGLLLGLNGTSSGGAFSPLLNPSSSITRLFLGVVLLNLIIVSGLSVVVLVFCRFKKFFLRPKSFLISSLALNRLSPLPPKIFLALSLKLSLLEVVGWDVVAVVVVVDV